MPLQPLDVALQKKKFQPVNCERVKSRVGVLESLFRKAHHTCLIMKGPGSSNGALGCP